MGVEEKLSHKFLNFLFADISVPGRDMSQWPQGTQLVFLPHGCLKTLPDPFFSSGGSTSFEVTTSLISLSLRGMLSPLGLIHQLIWLSCQYISFHLASISRKDDAWPVICTVFCHYSRLKGEDVLEVSSPKPQTTQSHLQSIIYTEQSIQNKMQTENQFHEFGITKI